MSQSKDSGNTEQKCSFCGRGPEHVQLMISGPGVMICDHCIRASSQIVRQNSAKKRSRSIERFPNPQQVKEYLDEYIIGQDEAKRKIAVAVYNHYKRISVPR